MKHEKIN